MSIINRVIPHKEILDIAREVIRNKNIEKDLDKHKYFNNKLRSLRLELNPKICSFYIISNHCRVTVLLTRINIDNVQYYICLNGDEYREYGIELPVMMLKNRLPNYLIERSV